MAETSIARRETILVVDDMEPVRELVVSILQEAGFHILQAGGGAEALKISADYPERIDLLLSDIQMPGVAGPELGEALKKSRPEMHVMFMSGFIGGRLLVLNYGWAFIEKPFIPVKLVEMINIVLRTRDKSQGTYQYDTRQDTEKREEPSRN